MFFCRLKYWARYLCHSVTQGSFVAHANTFNTFGKGKNVFVCSWADSSSSDLYQSMWITRPSKPSNDELSGHNVVIVKSTFLLLRCTHECSSRQSFGCREGDRVSHFPVTIMATDRKQLRTPLNFEKIDFDVGF